MENLRECPFCGRDDCLEITSEPDIGMMVVCWNCGGNQSLDWWQNRIPHLTVIEGGKSEDD